MANVATKTHGKHEPKPRPEVKTEAPQENGAKRGKGRPKGSGSGKSQTGKAKFSVPEGGFTSLEQTAGWNKETHARLRAGDFASKELFDAWKEKNPVERNYPSTMQFDENEKPVPVDSFFENVSITLSDRPFEYSEKLPTGEVIELVPLRNSHFTPKGLRELAKAKADVLENELQNLRKIADMSDADLADMIGREELGKSLSRKAKTKEDAEKLFDATLDTLSKMFTPEQIAELLAKGQQKVAS